MLELDDLSTAHLHWETPIEVAIKVVKVLILKKVNLVVFGVIYYLDHVFKLEKILAMQVIIVDVIEIKGRNWIILDHSKEVRKISE